MRCPRPDSNGHAHTGTGPQPAVYTIPPRGHYAEIIADLRHLSTNPPSHPAAYLIGGGILAPRQGAVKSLRQPTGRVCLSTAPTWRILACTVAPKRALLIHH